MMFDRRSLLMRACAENVKPVTLYSQVHNRGLTVRIERYINIHGPRIGEGHGHSQRAPEQLHRPEQPRPPQLCQDRSFKDIRARNLGRKFTRLTETIRHHIQFPDHAFVIHHQEIQIAILRQTENESSQSTRPK